MIALNNFATANDYSEGSTRRQPQTVRVNVIVAPQSGLAGSGSIFLQLAESDPPSGNNWSQDELFLVSGLYSLDRRCSGARVRSGAAGKPTQVTLQLLTQADLG